MGLFGGSTRRNLYIPEPERSKPEIRYRTSRFSTLKAGPVIVSTTGLATPPRVLPPGLFPALAPGFATLSTRTADEFLFQTYPLQFLAFLLGGRLAFRELVCITPIALLR